MAKEKKISFRFLLNDKSNPHGLNKDKYILYIRVNFNRNNTVVSSGLYFTKEEFSEKFTDGLDKYGVLKDTLKNIESAVRYEYQLMGNKHSLKGLFYRMSEIYEYRLNAVLEPFNLVSQFLVLPDSFQDVFRNYDLEFHGNQINIFQFYNVYKIFKSDFNLGMGDAFNELLIGYYMLSLKYGHKLEGDWYNEIYPSIKTIDWITHMRKDFLEFLKNKDQAKGLIDRNRNKVNEYLLNDFTYEEEKYLLYVDAISKKIDSQIKSSVLKPK